MIFITGDKHGSFESISKFCYINGTTKSDILIILGDVGLNYYLNKKDNYLKRIVSKLPITIFCIQGNHEERPSKINKYNIKYKYKYKRLNVTGKIYVEEKYPNILFAENGEIYLINDKIFYVIGGAYSIDKYFRLEKQKNGFDGYYWFEDEQLSKEEKDKILNDFQKNINIDYILSHTCPKKYIPTEEFLSWVNQDTVDDSMEIFLDKIEDIAIYKKWYCGHWHINKNIDKISFLYDSIECIR